MALLSYPTLVEPHLSVVLQARLWEVGYGMLALLTIGCAMFLWRSREPKIAPAASVVETANAPAAPALKMSQRLRWLALAFAPSSLMLGVTTFISTDLASAPLLWVIPLALYLVTFVLAFSRGMRLFFWAMVGLQPFLVAGLMAHFSSDEERLWVILLLHLASFFVTAMVCHGELARSRPPTAHLTEFYIWMSIGGVLGGLFNALVAPLVFSSVVEYPLIIAAAFALRPRWGAVSAANWSGQEGDPTGRHLAKTAVTGSLGELNPPSFSDDRRESAPAFLEPVRNWLRRHLLDLMVPVWILFFMMAISDFLIPTRLECGLCHRRGGFRNPGASYVPASVGASDGLPYDKSARRAGGIPVEISRSGRPA